MLYVLVQSFCYKGFVFFSFLFISTKYLKNHSKLQENHKIENLILLDSTWAYLHSKYIIWYTLVQMFVVALIYKIIHSCSFYDYLVGLKHPHIICSWCIYTRGVQQN